MRGLLVLALLVAFAGPTAAQASIDNPTQPTPTTLYLHLQDVQDMVMNTQPPTAGYRSVASWGVISATLPCNVIPEAVALGNQGPHTWYGYASPARIEYNDQQFRSHPERGVALDIHLVGNNLTLVWYLVAGQQTASAPAAPVPHANVVVTATLREGDDVSMDDEAFNVGARIATGQVGPVHLFADQVQGGNGQVRALGLVDEGWLYEFTLRLDVERAVIKRTTGFNLRIDAAFDNDVCPGFAPGGLNAVTTPLGRPRLELAVSNPLRIEYLGPQLLGDDLVLHASVSSAWGNYDVDQANATLEVRGPGNAAFQAVPPPVSVHHHMDCHGCEPLDAYFIWPGAAHAAAGTYEVRYAVPNLQASAVAVATTAFTIEAPTELPAPGMPVAAASLVGLALLLARRR